MGGRLDRDHAESLLVARFVLYGKHQYISRKIGHLYVWVVCPALTRKQDLVLQASGTYGVFYASAYPLVRQQRSGDDRQ